MLFHFTFVSQATFLIAPTLTPDQRSTRMDTGSLDHAIAVEGSASGVSVILPPGESNRTWTKQKWSTYLQQMRTEVEAAEAPIKVYLHGLEILSAQQDTKWACLHKEPAANQDQASTDQGGTSSCPPMPNIKKTEVAHSFTSLWTTKEWTFLFCAAQDLKEHAAWLHHVAHRKAPKVRPSPTKPIQGKEKTDKGTK